MAKARRQKKMKSLSEQTSEEADERRRKATESVARREKTKKETDLILEGDGFRAVEDGENEKIYVTIDTSNDAGLSKPGKMRFCATSKGWKRLGDLGILLMVGRKV